MKLLEIYLARNRDKTWFDKYSSLAKGNYGRLFEYTNTNFRKQASFSSQFEEFEKVEGKDRSSWGLVESHGQEADKQRVVNMLASKLFKRDPKGGEDEKDFIYSKTAKGKLYKKFLQGEFSEEERWFINYLFLLDGHYAGERRYITTRTAAITVLYSDVGLKKKDLLKFAAEVINSELRMAELLRKDFFFLHSFYADSEFLELYIHASAQEKEELAFYIETNLEDQNDVCCISKKYRSGGNFNPGMFVDETKVFYFSSVLLDIKEVDIEQVLGGLLKIYNSFFVVDSAKIVNYTVHHSEVLYLVLTEALGKEVTLEEPETETVAQDLEPQEYIDDTTFDGKSIAKQIFASKKKRARDLAGHRCSLEKLNNCKYFTSKAHNERYVEVHHLIPQEFRNEFAYSIEVFANYVTLCAFCHEMLHKAVDNEKISSLNYLYNERKERLEAMNLRLDLQVLYSFYKMG